MTQRTAANDAALIREHFADGSRPYHCVDCIEPDQQAALDAVVRLLDRVTPRVIPAEGDMP